MQLRGYLICPQCGKLLTGSASKGRNAKYYYYHRISSCGTRFKSENANELFSRELKKFVPRSGMVEVYANVLNVDYKKRSTVQRGGVKTMHEKIEILNENIGKARKKFLTDKIGEKDYYEFKRDCEKEIERLEADLIKITGLVSKIDSLLRKAIENLANLRELFENTDVKGKRKIIGSIFPEKLVFDGFAYRTARVNEAVKLIFNVGKAFRKLKTGQTEENFDLSS